MPRFSRILVLSLFSALACGRPVQAQPAQTLTVGLGGHFQQISEDLFNGLRYQGVVPGGLVEVRTLGEQDARLFSLAAGVGQIANRFDYPMLSIDARLGYGYAPRVASWHGDRLKLYLGGMGGTTYALRQFSWEDSDHVYWFTRYELSGLAMAQLALPADMTLVWRAELPLLALVSRPPAERLYNNDKPTPAYLLAKANENLAGTSALDYHAVSTSLSLQFPLAPRWQQSLSYDLRWSAYASPQPTGDLQHGLTTRTSYSF